MNIMNHFCFQSLLVIIKRQPDAGIFCSSCIYFTQSETDGKMKKEGDEIQNYMIFREHVKISVHLMLFLGLLTYLNYKTCYFLTFVDILLCETNSGSPISDPNICTSDTANNRKHLLCILILH